MNYNYSVSIIDEKAELVHSASAELSHYYSRKKHRSNIFMAIIQIDPIVGYLKNRIGTKKRFYVHLDGSQYVIKARIIRIHKIAQERHYEIGGTVTEETIAAHMKYITTHVSNKRITMLLTKRKTIEVGRKLTF